MQGIWLLLLILAGPASSVEIDVGDRSLSGSEPVLVKTFLSLKKGELRRAREVRFCDAGGRPIVSDCLAAAKWEDGSIRILFVKGVVPAHRARGCFRLFLNKKPGPESRRGIEVSRSRRVVVDTGVVSLSLDRYSPRFVAGGRILGKKIKGLEKGFDLFLMLDGAVFRPKDIVLAIEEGRAETKAFFRGMMRDPAMGPGPAFELVLTFTAGSGRVGVRIVLEGGPLSGSSTGAFLEMFPPWAGSPGPVVVRAGGISSVRAPQRCEEILLRALPKQIEVSEKGDVESLRKTGDSGVLLKGCRPRFSIDFPCFGALHPWSVRVRQGGMLSISLLNDRFLWEPFFSFQRDFAVTFREKRLSRAEPAECPRGVLYALPKNRDYRMVLFEEGPGPDRDETESALLFDVCTALVKRLDNEWKRWDGFMDFGDYRKSYGIWANQEYDPAFGLIKRYLRTGKENDLDRALISLRHWLRFDRAGQNDPLAAAGVPWMHGRSHRSGRTEPGHAWLDGALLAYFLTGEREYLDAALGVGDYLVDSVPRLKETSLERSVSWSLAALAALVGAGHEKYRGPMNKIARILRSRQDDEGFMTFKESLCDEKACYVVNSWVTSGITVEALYRHYMVTGDLRSAESALRAADAIMSCCGGKEENLFFQRVFINKGKGELVSRSGRVEGGRAALLALGAVRAWQLGGGERFRKKAGLLMRKAAADLSRDPPSYPGEDLAMLFRSIVAW